MADRTNYDLTQHQEQTSGQDLTYFRPGEEGALYPLCGGASLGADRVTLALLVDAYDEEVVGARRTAPTSQFCTSIRPGALKGAVLPLSKKLSGRARRDLHQLQKDCMVDFDDTGSIGKRYRREDEIGTP